LLLAGFSAAEAQTGRAARLQPAQPNGQQQQPRVIPAPAAVQQPNLSQPNQPGQPQPGQPQTAPLKPSPNGPPQENQAANNTPAAMPSTPPLVTYREGLLTVQAANSSLNSVLTAIRSKTGIEFEGQENVSDRVALSLGPAPAGEVLSAIFSGSKFGFVAIGRPDNPAIVQRVILTPKTQPGAVAAAQPQPRQNNGQEGEENPDEAPDETPSVNNGGDPQDIPAQPPVTQPQNQPPQGPKSPEQLLQELQEMRKQQQMQQEGNPPPNPGQVPRKMPPR
jgi:hypothetical protein